jgi:predicted glycoside hydrolase/deacetylase ChbG (UPF0249 family)
MPTLVDPKTGRFQATLAAFLARLMTGRIRSSEIEAEAAAQIRLLQSKGLALTHIDTHKHAHMFPAVLRPVLRAARAAGIDAIRNPFEPAWAVRATAGAFWVRVAEVNVLRRLHATCRRIIAEQDFSTTDGAIGIAGTGTLNASTIREILQQLPAGTWELVTHPGYNDADLDKVRTRLRASRDTERTALSTIKEFPALDLIPYSALHSEAYAIP